MTTENSNPTVRAPFACKVCIFYDPESGPEARTGLCRRHSPQRLSSGFGYWPVVADNDWCGEGETAYDRNPVISWKWPTHDSGLERIAEIIGGKENAR